MKFEDKAHHVIELDGGFGELSGTCFTDGAGEVPEILDRGSGGRFSLRRAPVRPGRAWSGPAALTANGHAARAPRRTPSLQRRRRWVALSDDGPRPSGVTRTARVERTSSLVPSGGADRRIVAAEGKPTWRRISRTYPGSRLKPRMTCDTVSQANKELEDGQ